VVIAASLAVIAYEVGDSPACPAAATGKVEAVWPTRSPSMLRARLGARLSNRDPALHPVLVTVAVMRQETGSWRWTLFYVALLLAIALASSFIMGQYSWG